MGYRRQFKQLRMYFIKILIFEVNTQRTSEAKKPAKQVAYGYFLVHILVLEIHVLHAFWTMQLFAEDSSRGEVEGSDGAGPIPPDWMQTK